MTEPDREHNTIRRRILYVDHTATLGGGELALLDLVRNLDTERFVPIVLLCSDGPLAVRLKEARIETHIVPLASSIVHTRKDSLGGKTLLRARDAGRFLTYLFQLARFIKAQKIDLVHTNSLKADILGGFAARIARRPVLWHVRDRIDEDYLPGSVVRIFRRLCRLLPNFVVANSEATLKTLMLPPARPCAAVPSGIDLGARQIQIGTETESSLPGDRIETLPTRRLGLIGRISPWKGQHIFLQAAARVRQTFPETRFLIVGAALFEEQAYEQELHQLAASLNLEECVEFTGFRSDVAEIIESLDILVHASTSGEPFGQVIVQGMAAAKPVVATRGGGAVEIVLDGVTGYLVPMGEAEAMADAICRLLADPETAREMGRLGYQRVCDHFTIEHTVRKMEGIYTTMLPGRKD